VSTWGIGRQVDRSGHETYASRLGRTYRILTKALIPLDGTSEAMAATTPAQTVATAKGASVSLLAAIESDAAGADSARASGDLELVARDLRQGESGLGNVAGDRRHTMSIFGALPAWAVGLLALGAGGILLYLNYGWLLAARAMLAGRRRKDASTSDTSAIGRDPPTRRSAT
jgi:hypothetical protein